MIEIPALDATLISKDLEQIKTLTIRNVNYLELVPDLLDKVRAETHANIINGCNFRRNIKVLRATFNSAQELHHLEDALDKDMIIKVVCKLVNPMLKALSDYIIDKPTKEDLEGIKKLEAIARIKMIDKSTKTDSEFFKEFDDFVEDESEEEEEDIEDIDLLESLRAVKAQKEIEMQETVESNLRNSVLKRLGVKVQDSKFRERLKLDLSKLNKVYKQQKVDLKSKPFAALSVLKAEPVELTKDKIVQSLIDEDFSVLNNLSKKDIKQLRKDLDGYKKEGLMINSEEFVKDQMESLKAYSLENYSVPQLKQDQEFLIFTGPVYVIPDGYLNKTDIAHIPNVQAKFVFPGWVFDNQTLVTIPRATYKDTDKMKSLVDKLLAIMKKSTGKYWVNITEGTEFSTKGFPNQVFLWFINQDYVKWLGSFGVQSVSFPYDNIDRKYASADVLKTKREKREEEAQTYLSSVEDKIEKLEKQFEKDSKLLEINNQFVEKTNILLEELKEKAKSLNMGVKLDARLKINTLEKKIEEKNIKQSSKNLENLRLLIKRLNKRVNNVLNEMCSSEVDINTFDLNELFPELADV